MALGCANQCPATASVLHGHCSLSALSASRSLSDATRWSVARSVTALNQASSCLTSTVTGLADNAGQKIKPSSLFCLLVTLEGLTLIFLSIFCLDAKTTLLDVSVTAALLVSMVTRTADHVTAMRRGQRRKYVTLEQDIVSVR